MRRLHIGVSVLGLVLALGSTAWASTLAPTSQARSVEATAVIDFGEVGSDSVTESDVAPGFGVFNSTVSADPNGILNTPGLSATAGQYSEFMPSAINANGTVSADADPGGPIGGMTADSSSQFSVTFTISSAVNYTLSGNIDATAVGGTGAAHAGVTLTGPGGTIYDLETFGGALPALSTGTLTPGSYTLSAFATSEMAFGTDSGESTFNISFVIPEPSACVLALGIGLLAMRRRSA